MLDAVHHVVYLGVRWFTFIFWGVFQYTTFWQHPFNSKIYLNVGNILTLSSGHNDRSDYWH